MIRNDFVSNSSSSSFIVIADNVTKIDESHALECVRNVKSIALPTKRGNYQFGWENKSYEDIWSKLNFCAIQLHYLKGCVHTKKHLEKLPTYYREFYEKYTFDKCLKMFQEVCKEYLNLDVTVKLEFGEDEKYDYYIDHQSAAYEARNMDMFKNKNALYTFLLTENSYIQCGNDNDYYD